MRYSIRSAATVSGSSSSTRAALTGSTPSSGCHWDHAIVPPQRVVADHPAAGGPRSAGASDGAGANHPLPGGHRPPGSFIPSLRRSSVLRHRREGATMFNLRNRSFLKEIDFEPRELRLPAAALRGGEDRQVRRHRGEAARGQGDRPDLREDLDPHEVGVRGRRLRPGCPRHLPRPVRVAARPQGVRRRHGARAGPDVRRHRVPRQRARPTSRSWRPTPACPSTTASPTSGTRPRCWPTS